MEEWTVQVNISVKHYYYIFNSLTALLEKICFDIIGTLVTNQL